jgi:threonine dehydratase
VVPTPLMEPNTERQRLEQKLAQLLAQQKAMQPHADANADIAESPSVADEALVAARDVAAVEVPLGGGSAVAGAAPSAKKAKKLRCCAQCNVTATKMKKCGNCMTTRYCSIECQRTHWEIHKLYCVPVAIADDQDDDAADEDDSP